MNHIPVLTKEVIQFLAPRKNENFIDATIGFGGHAEEILKRTAPGGRLLGIDQDSVALAAAKKKLKKFIPRVDFIQTNFSEIGLIIRKWHKEINGILFDLGVSSYQLTSMDRGFSFQQDSPLDMRMSPESQRLTAQDIVNYWDKNRLKKIFWEMGEEPMSGRIAQEIIIARNKKPIETTNDLVTVIEKAIPRKIQNTRKKHFATNIFRALRMEVNQELPNLRSALKQSKQILSPGGRLVIISFHSLEDRLVKNFFRENEELKILTDKPVVPTEKEIKNNPRSRSAKLRAVVKNPKQK